ncbi:MAG: hypothetical protein ABH822_00325 [Patescibacteria group bacterium]
MEELNSNKGQSLLEIIIAIAVAVITIMAAIMVLILMLRITDQDVSLQTAVFLEQKTMDEVTVILQKDWQSLSATASSTEAVVIDDVDYEVVFQVSPVSRDGGGSIVESGGTVDAATKKIDVFINWNYRGDTAEYKAEKYLTRSGNYIFQQTDWSGGAITSPEPVFDKSGNSFYSADGNVDYRTQPGELKLNL